MRRPALLVAVAAAAASLLLAGCGDSSSDTAGSSSSASASADGLKGTVTVFAAASLTESFTTLGKQFEQANPSVTVKFNFGASSALAESIGQGAPADVFASASTKTMDGVSKDGDAVDPKDFARNTMEIAVPPDNPGEVTALADLAKPGLKVALCQEQVPCGATAKKVLDQAEVTVTPKTLGADVKSVLTTVSLGEVDAGIVYKTDVRAAGDKVKGIEIPADQNASTAYPIATLKDAPNADGAKAFVDYVLSADGTKVLEAAGFTAP
ncbi:molybdate ABC transporter substrate-binding protein [Cryptosporangium arvum]|uniref:Molybdenum ABC transporter, periplasmic molybdate-binding protein n=1 Tax=Cryptosporangium arvum DSM 44712 TaxID=927661 RepID=A0A010YX24_9ACTN|nr:molybdate ABC transporter substrate-binding protein [Cryptosporangium arvum]EXG79703.1 molybdenum ABC transporter, periplasmic molybdate-binding protein [Cryptosporangium arvum DSM 44712]